MGPLILQRPHPDTLIVTKRRSSNAFRLVFEILFFAIWYVGVTRAATNREEGLFHYTLVILLFFLAPLFYIPTILAHAKAAFSQVSIVFDRKTQLVTECGERVSSFAGIDKVELHERDDNDGSKFYVVNLIFRNGKKKEIERSYSVDIVQAAQIIANHIKRPYSYLK